MTSTASQSILIDLLPELVQIEGGAFEMGSNKSDRERPIHSVQVPTFHMGKYPITNAQYALFLNTYGSAIVKSGPNQGQKMVYEHHWGMQQSGRQWEAAEGFANHPVINVTWYGAEAYCQWLCTQTGERYRLPSESEWEYAAKGGKYKPPFQYAGSNHLDEVGWYEANSHGQTKPIGLKWPNQLDLYDMSGNVFEWCADHWHGNYKGAPTDGSVWIKGGDQKRRVVRGGSWFDDGFNCRVSYRDWFFAYNWVNYIGFRVSRY